MARPLKEGMDYFPHDVDASNDEKIEALREEFGNDGYAMYFILLERIYKTNTGELDINKVVIKKSIIRHIGIPEDKFNKMLEFCFEIELFDRDIYNKTKVLTSTGVKSRRGEVEKHREKWRKRKVIQKENNNDKEFSNEKTQQITPQSKVKESKVKEIKENNINNSNFFDDGCNDNDFNIFNYMQHRGFISISSIMAQQIIDDIHTYSLEEVKRAIDIADNNNAHTYSYVKRVLENGRNKANDQSNDLFLKMEERIKRGEDPF